MIKCTQCNTENEESNKFCRECGAKLEVAVFCEMCGTKLAPGAKFCPECGARLEKPKCSNPLTSGNTMVNGNVDASLRGDVAGNPESARGPLATDNAIINGSSIDTSVRNSTTNNDFSTKNIDYRGAEINNGPVYKGPVDQRVTQNIFNDSAVQCSICGKTMVKGSPEHNVCVSCGKAFCLEHFDKQSNMCASCLSDIEDNIRSGEYGKASSACRMAMARGASNPDLCFYNAVCILKGKKAFVQQKTDIKDIIMLLEKAVSLEPKPIYMYFLAYVKYDYYARNFFAIKPDYKQCLYEAKNLGLTEEDKMRLFSLLKVERPSCL